MNALIEDIVEDLAKISARLEEAVNPEQSKRGTKKNKKVRPDARRAILGACFDAALDADQRRLLTRKDKARVVLIKVPTTSWIHDVELYFTDRFSTTWQTFARDGNRTRQQANTDPVEVAIAIAGGKSVVGIAANVDVLPSTLLASADLVVRIQMPSGKVIEDAILRFKGRRPPAPVENDIVAGLDFFDLVAAFRPSSTIAEIIARLRTASNERRGASRLNDDVPILATAVEYGAARDWGLALAQDIRDYRAGLIGWNAIDRGAVLYSEPGLGKSLFARMLAKECGLPLVISSVAELFAKSAGDLGAVIQAERQVFAQASALAPAILLLDELDGLPSRANMSNRGRDWWTPLINDFLTNLDSAISNQREGVIVVGATNFIEHIDPALLRPGRLERCIHIARPNLEGTVNILRYHVRDRDFRERDLASVGRMIEGFTGAEIMMLVRDARRLARQEKRDLTIEDLRTIALPPIRNNDKLMARNSIHEAGHAVTCLGLGVGQVKKVVVGAGNDGSEGQTQIDFAANDGMTRQALDNNITMLLSGRAAEKVILGAASVGSGGADQSDLARATRLVVGMYVSVGLVDSLTYLGAIAEAHQHLSYDPILRAKVENHLQRLQKRADALVRKYRIVIEKVAEALQERRYLSGDTVREIFDDHANRTEQSND